MMIAGVDYTLPLVILASFAFLFTVQYLLLRSRHLRFLRHLPWVWVVGVLGLAVTAYFGDSGGFIDLRSFFALLLCGYAAICAAAIGLAHLIFKLQKR